MGEERTQPAEARPWEGRAILHVDMDAFFASVEQLDHPEWRGKPVIVGGSATSRGVVCAASYEARVFGVRSAMPSVRAHRLCPQAIWAPVRFARYREFSDRIFAIFREEAALVQPVSVDEAYIDVSPGRFTSEHPVSIARRIQERIDAIGLSASIGVATSRTVAKIASDHDKPHGLTVVPSGEEAAFLAPLPVRDMPGIGPRTAERLTTLGVRTLGDLAALDDATSRAVLGTHGTALVRRARGIDESQVRQHRGAKSLSAERTFSRDVHEETEVEEILRSLAEKVGRRLRRAELVGRTVTVKVRFADFSTRTVQRTLSAPTDDEIEIFPVARSLVREVWTPGVGLRLLGLGLSGFGERSEQLSLAACEEGAPYGNDVAARQEERRQKLTPGLDAVRERFGDDAVAFGSELRRRKQRESGD